MPSYSFHRARFPLSGRRRAKFEIDMCVCVLSPGGSAAVGGPTPTTLVDPNLIRQQQQRARAHPWHADRCRCRPIKKATGILANVAVCIFSVLLFLTGSAQGQAYHLLHSFAGGADGKTPYSGVVVSGNEIFGTTLYGGDAASVNGPGTVYSLSTSGANYSLLHQFQENSGGANPWGGLTLVNSNLYGTTELANSPGTGTVFTIGTSGGGFSSLYTFNSASGAYPVGDLATVNSTLYGLASGGGSSNSGTIFSISTAGSNFSTLHSFDGAAGGQYPYSKPTISGNTMYGTTLQGGLGPNGSIGTIFSCNLDGTNFRVLYSFNNFFSQGYDPFDYGGLLLIGSKLYGTAYYGGSGPSQNGTVFSINTDGTGFTVLHTFAGNDGSGPQGGLVLVGNQLYGDTTYGGANGNNDGTIYSMNLDGSGFRTVYSFSGPDGAQPFPSLTLSGNELYGTTSAGGSAGDGVVFSLAVPEPSSLALVGIGGLALLRRRRHVASLAT